MPGAVRWVELGLESGTRRWGGVTEGGFSSTGLNGSPPAGTYEPRVKQFGRVTFGGLDRAFSLRLPECQITVADEDATLHKIVASGEPIQGQPASVNTWISAAGAAGPSFTSAVIGAPPQQTGEAEWQLKLRFDDSALNSVLPRVRMRRSDWPLADPANWGKPAPMIWGLHDSAGITNTGAFPTLCMDTTNFLYVVAWGWVEVLRVYKNGVRAISGYTVTHPIVGGHRWTVIDSTTLATITCDVSGYETVGDGSGTLVSRHGEQLRHFLRNVGFATTPPPRGMWYASNDAKIIASDFDLPTMAVRAGGSGYRGSRYIGSDTTLLSEVNGWGSTWRIQPYISRSGRLGLMYDDPQETAVNWQNGGARWYRHPQHFATLKQEHDSDGLIGRVTVDYSRLQSGGSASLEVFDPSSRSQAAEGLSSMPWGPAFG